MKPSRNILLTFGINGSLRKREVQGVVPHTEYYLFNSAANLKAYSNNGLDFAYYGYNASNTRTYKLSMQNMGQWVNGQPQPIHLQIQQAMFYPNTYLNFNQNGEYTKHYYNGSERIASRLGNTALSISMEMTDRLQERVGKLETRFQDDIRELVYTNVQVETPPVSATSLQQTGTPTDIFYYHTNHLGSTAYVTDQSQNVTQGFLYAPFGEITTEYAPLWQNATLPKYAFNAKELDEETGMYYYEARYYKPPVFTSRDPMFEKYFWMTPYAYCANNPVKYVDPSGREIDDPPIHHNFLISVGVQIYNSSKEHGTSNSGAVLVLAQAALESGWGNTTEKYGDYNLFGLMGSPGSPSKRSTSHGNIKDYSSLGGYSACITDYFKRAENLWPTWKEVLAQEEFTYDDIDKALNTGEYYPTKEERHKGKYPYAGASNNKESNYGESLMNQFYSTKKRFLTLTANFSHRYNFM